MGPGVCRASLNLISLKTSTQTRILIDGFQGVPSCTGSRFAKARWLEQTATFEAAFHRQSELLQLGWCQFPAREE